MKNNVCILCLVLFLSTNVYAGIFGNLFGFSPKYEKRINELENSISKQMSDNRLEVVGLKSKIDKLEVKVSAIAQGTANTEAKISGFDKSIKDIKNISSGRDTITKQVNDSKLMAKMFQGQRNSLGAICLALIAALKFVYSGSQKRLKEKDEHAIKLEVKRQQYRTLWLEKIAPRDAETKKKYEKDNMEDKC